MRADNQFPGKNRAGHPLGMPLFSARARRRDDAPSTDAKNSLDLRTPRQGGEVEASVARCLRTPPDVATRQGLKSVFQTALRGLSHRSIVVVGNYCYGPITAEPYRAKARPLYPRLSYFAPIICPPRAAGLREIGTTAHGQVVEAPGTAPGSDRLIPTAIYRHSRQAGSMNIGADGVGIKWVRGRARRLPPANAWLRGTELRERIGHADVSAWVRRADLLFRTCTFDRSIFSRRRRSCPRSGRSGRVMARR